MRSPQRIRPFLDQLARVWEANPDLRFGQLIDILFSGIDTDPFFLEDDEMLKEIKRHFSN